MSLHAAKIIILLAISAAFALCDHYVFMQSLSLASAFVILTPMFCLVSLIPTSLVVLGLF